MKEERNRLVKVRLYYQGKNQWRLVPVAKKDGSQIRRGDILFRGDDNKLKLLLQRLKAKDNQTDPPSSKNRTYQQMIDSARDTSDPYIWIWINKWNEYKKTNQITQENTMKDIITIKKDVRIPGTNVILESGDKIKIVEASDEPSVKEIIDKAEKYANTTGGGSQTGVRRLAKQALSYLKRNPNPKFIKVDNYKEIKAGDWIYPFKGMIAKVEERLEGDEFQVGDFMTSLNNVKYKIS